MSKLEENRNMGESSRSFKEQRILEIMLIYYSREDVRKAMFKFSQNRECIPRYFEGFGKRPDNFQYESDILEQVRKGATSFHCSEELWSDPLEISTDLSKEEFNEIRTGWDLLLDIDSPYLEYSKIYAKLLVEALRLHGVENIGVKFSGSKGFHIIIPWKAFPEEIYGQKTKDMFPEWPRIICQYLTEIIQPKLSEKLFEEENLSEIAKKIGKTEDELTITECLSCNRPAKKSSMITWHCPSCKKDIINQEGTYNNRKKAKCPDCRKELVEISRETIYLCDFCQINSNKKPELFGETRTKTESLIEADLILVASRHLFRMPYSLHEKTALASIVIDKDKIKEFQITDAKPLRVQIKDYYPESKKEEAKNLLLQALDWKERKEREGKDIQIKREKESNLSPNFNEPKKAGNYKQISIPNPNEDIFPPCIKILLKGIKNDGRKRALFILINFFKSLGVPDNELEKKINNWNEKNSVPLKKGYIQSQLLWYKKNGTRMPPNCDKPNYKDMLICQPDELCRQVKNPINYAVKKYFKNKN